MVNLTVYTHIYIVETERGLKDFYNYDKSNDVFHCTSFVVARLVTSRLAEHSVVVTKGSELSPIRRYQMKVNEKGRDIGLTLWRLPYYIKPTSGFATTLYLGIGRRESDAGRRLRQTDNDR